MSTRAHTDSCSLGGASELGRVAVSRTVASLLRKFCSPSDIRGSTRNGASEDQPLIPDWFLLQGPSYIPFSQRDSLVLLAVGQGFPSERASSARGGSADLDAEVVAGCWDPCLERIFAHTQLHSEPDPDSMGFGQNEVILSARPEYYWRCWRCGKTSVEAIQDLTLSVPRTTAPGMLELLSCEGRPSREESSDDSEETVSEGRSELCFFGQDDAGTHRLPLSSCPGQREDEVADAAWGSGVAYASGFSVSLNSSAGQADGQEVWESGTTGCGCACVTSSSAGTYTHECPSAGVGACSTYGSLAQTSCSSPCCLPHVGRLVQTPALVFRLGATSEGTVSGENADERHCRQADVPGHQCGLLVAAANQKVYVGLQGRRCDVAQWRPASAGEPLAATPPHFKLEDPTADGEQPSPRLQGCGVVTHICMPEDREEQGRQEVLPVAPNTYASGEEQMRSLTGPPDVHRSKESVSFSIHSLSRSTTASSLAGTADRNEVCCTEISSCSLENAAEKAVYTCCEVWPRKRVAGDERHDSGSTRTWCGSSCESFASKKSCVRQLPCSFEDFRLADRQIHKWAGSEGPGQAVAEASSGAYRTTELPPPAFRLADDSRGSRVFSGRELIDISAVDAVVPSASPWTPALPSVGTRTVGSRETAMGPAFSERLGNGSFRQMNRLSGNESYGSSHTCPRDLEAIVGARTTGCSMHPFSCKREETLECAGQLGVNDVGRTVCFSETEKASVQTQEDGSQTGCDAESLFRSCESERGSSVSVFGSVLTSTAGVQCVSEAQRQHLSADGGDPMAGSECGRVRIRTTDSCRNATCGPTHRLKRHLEDELEGGGRCPVKKASRDLGDRKTGRNDGRVAAGSREVAGDAVWPAECGGQKSPSSSSQYQMSDDSGSQGTNESNLRWHEGFTLPLGKDGRGELIKRMRSVHKADRDFCRFTLESMGVDFKRLAHATVEELWKIAHSWGLFGYAVKLSRKYGKTATNSSRRKAIHPLRAERPARFCM